METITLGGGCFWCMEAVFQRLEGVLSVTSGYSGGNTLFPSYQEVCSGTTLHAEVVQIVFDNKNLSAEDLLYVFFAVHDPTTLNRQGNDVGTQYRSVIFYHNTTQKDTAVRLIKEIGGAFDAPIVTQVEPVSVFYKAESYHQNYYQNHPDLPYCKMMIMPKIHKMASVFTEKLKD